MGGDLEHSLLGKILNVHRQMEKGYPALSVLGVCGRLEPRAARCFAPGWVLSGRWPLGEVVALLDDDFEQEDGT